MKNSLKLFIVVSLFTCSLFAQKASFKLEKTKSFFPNDQDINQENIEWAYLTVPENWEENNGKTIQIAVAILKKNFSRANPNPVIYLEGGPGAGSIRDIRRWIRHPLRQNSDIILMDIRGTGHSIPNFCPDLGHKFLEILSKNQSTFEDEQQKIKASVECKRDLIIKGVDLRAYNSINIANDLNALKKALKYSKWNVYGISYGTYIVQNYANIYPNDIKSLILDSPISDIREYYNRNTSNYIKSLEKIFSDCEKNLDCSQNYPNLEHFYYETIEELDQKPITVKVDKQVVSTGNFTYNSEDFKIAIQQCLYQKKLIEVLPLLIMEFNKRSTGTLSSLVAAFSGALGLDYGLYYTISCNDVLPSNSISKFKQDAAKYENLKGGLSFYKSDFLVCEAWNSNLDKIKKNIDDLPPLSSIATPVLIFSGEYDPITPTSNAKETFDKFENSYLIKASSYGHGPSLSYLGYEIVNAFINNPIQDFEVEGFPREKINFVTDVTLNEGISNMANSLNDQNLLFFSPLIIALIILLISIFRSIYQIVRKNEILQNRIISALVACASILIIVTIIGFIESIKSTANKNFYILAFGVSSEYDHLFLLNQLFILFTIAAIGYFVYKVRTISNKVYIATILFSLVLTGVYMQYWGF